MMKNLNIVNLTPRPESDAGRPRCFSSHHSAMRSGASCAVDRAQVDTVTVDGISVDE